MALQGRLAGDAIIGPAPWGRRLAGLRIAGADASCPRGGTTVRAAVVTGRLARPATETLGALFEVEEVALAEMPAPYPYVPGLLSFREIPVLLAAFEKVGDVDAVVCDGQGLAHPRRMGLACHLGMLLDVPAVGCAKSRLCGEHGDVGPRRGDSSPLRFQGRTVGRALRTRQGVKPLYVSPGHRTDVAGAVRLVLACGSGYRLPHPTRLADRAAGFRGKDAALLAELRRMARPG